MLTGLAHLSFKRRSPQIGSSGGSLLHLVGCSEHVELLAPLALLLVALAFLAASGLAGQWAGVVSERAGPGICKVKGYPT